MQLQTQKRNFVETVKLDPGKDEQLIIITTKNKVDIDNSDEQVLQIKKRYKYSIRLTIGFAILVITLFSFIVWLECKRNSEIIEKTATIIQTPSTIISQKQRKDKKLDNKKDENKANTGPKDESQKPKAKQLKQIASIKENKIEKENIQLKALKEFNPWNLNKKEKEALFQKYKKMPKSDPNKSDYMPIVQNREQEILPFLQEFEKTSQVVKYSQISMSQKQREQYQKYFNKKVQERLKKVEWKLRQQSSYITHPEKPFSGDYFKITRKKWYSAFQYHSLVGVNIDKKPQFRRIAQEQINYFERIYQTGKYKNQLKICLISPGLNNQGRDRYLWNVESVLQQNYTNYRIVIIDDLSTDNTVELLTKHLKWRNVSQDKITIVKNNKNQKATTNVFYATHKYCGLGQIQIVLDSDDQLIGRQVFKALNAIYQKEKPLSLYSNYIFSRGNPLKPLHFLGGSRDYLQIDIDNNNFRNSKIRGYSHLRTMLSDNFLLMKPQSLKDWRGQFYWIISDNAVYYSAMQMSCGKVKYLPELFVYYNFNTGLNDFQHVKTKQQQQQYQNILKHINQQKSYRCLAVQFFEISQYKP